MASEAKDKNFIGNQENTPGSGGNQFQGPSSQGSDSGPTSAGNRTSQFSTGTPTSQSSGGADSSRFVDLNKYLSANQGAGDRLYKGIDTKLGSEYDKSQKDTSTQVDSVKQGIQNAQSTLGRGQGYLDQTKDTNFDAQKFTQSQPNIVQDFSGFRTGKNVDVSGLNTQQNQAINATTSLTNQQQDRANLAGNELGRFDLLKQTYGNNGGAANNYTSGQQRLDNLFLQAGAGNNVGNLQNTIQNRLQNANNLTNTVNQYGNTIGTVNTQQQGLSKGLQDQTNLLEGNYVSGIQANKDTINNGRKTDISNANTGFNNLVAGNAIDSSLANTLQLNQGDRLLNTLVDRSNPSSYLNYGRTDLSTADELANKDQRNYYGSLGQLAGLDPNAYRVKSDTVVDPAVAAKLAENGKGVLRNAIDTKNVDFQNLLQNNAKSDTSVGRGTVLGGGINQVNADENYGYNYNYGKALNDIDSSNDATLNSLLGNSQFLNQISPNVNAYYNYNGKQYQNPQNILRNNGLTSAYNTLQNNGAFQRVNIK